MSGRVPYDDATKPGALMLRIMEYRVPEVTKHEAFAPFPELAGLLQKCWDHIPENRPSIGDFLGPLRSLVSSVVVMWIRHLLR